MWSLKFSEKNSTKDKSATSMPALLLIKVTNYSKLETIGSNSRPQARPIRRKTEREAKEAQTTRRETQSTVMTISLYPTLLLTTQTIKEIRKSSYVLQFKSPAKKVLQIPKTIRLK